MFAAYMTTIPKTSTRLRLLHKVPTTTPKRPLFSKYPQLGDLPISESAGGSWYDALTARFAANIGQVDDRSTRVMPTAATLPTATMAISTTSMSQTSTSITVRRSRILRTSLMPSYARNSRSAAARDSWAIQTAGRCHRWRLVIFLIDPYPQRNTLRRDRQRHDLAQQWTDEPPRPRRKRKAEQSDRLQVV